MHKYIVKGAQLLPTTKANLDISRRDQTLTVKIELAEDVIVEYIRDEINGTSTWNHVIDGVKFVKGKAPSKLSKALKSFIKDYNTYRSAAVRSGKITMMFGGKEDAETSYVTRTATNPNEVIDAIRPEEVVA